MSVTFIFGILAGEGIGMGKMIYRPPAGFQDDFIPAIGTNERAVRFRRKICVDDLAGGFLLCAKHGK